MTQRSNHSTRRDFVKYASTAPLALSLPTIVSARSLGLGAVPPSDRIVMGCIGTGGMGLHDMRVMMRQPEVQVVAVCDVETKSNFYHGGTVAGREVARQIVDDHYGKNTSGTSPQCAAYVDFRELLQRDDIDAVTVTTPDHWHALISIAAAQAGKDIYCEKPLANSVAEGRAVCTAVTENQRILQTGSHERSGSNARFAAELVRNGRIGKLHTIRIQMPCDESHHLAVRRCEGFPPALAVPEGFDYDRWLGPAAQAAYTPQRCHFWWRFILSYGGGEMTDRGAHVIDLAQLAAGFDDTGPVEIKAAGSAAANSLYDSYFDYEFENIYANGVRMIGSTSAPRGVKFEGTDGWIFVHVHGGKLESEPASLLKETIGEHEIRLGRSPGHQRNFLDSVKSRQTPMAPAEVGHRTGTICHLNNIAMRLGRPIKWDPVKELIENDDEANALLGPAMREPWKL